LTTQEACLCFKYEARRVKEGSDDNENKMFINVVKSVKGILAFL
jgi:hypothetical protein